MLKIIIQLILLEHVFYLNIEDLSLLILFVAIKMILF